MQNGFGGKVGFTWGIADRLRGASKTHEFQEPIPECARREVYLRTQERGDAT